MRVAIIGASNFDTIEYNFWEAFTHLGHTAKIFDDKEIISVCGSKSRAIVHLLSNSSYSFAKWAYNKLAHKVLNYKPDLVVVTYRHIIPEFVKKIKKNSKNVPVIHINPDAISRLQRGYLFATPYDAYFTKEPVLVDLMKNNLNLNAFYLPESFNPRVHLKPDKSKKECEDQMNIDIGIAASLYPYRIRFLESLLDILPKNLNISIYGTKVPWLPTRLWEYHTGKGVYGLDKAHVFFAARIVLNNMHYTEYKGVNCRFFEVLGSGGFQLCDDKPALSDLAEPGKEVVTFRNLQEAAEKIRYYLDHPKERLAIAEAGYQRAISEHTYEKRIETILSIINYS